MTDINNILNRLDNLLDKLETKFFEPIQEVDWSATAFRWRTNQQGRGYLQSIHSPHIVLIDSIQNCDLQKQRLLSNTQHFFEGKLANNALLTGARGTGKSSLVKACWNEFASKGLKIIEVDKDDLRFLIDIVDLISHRPEKFLLFCDDLSFEDGETSYKALKSVLEGSIVNPSANMLFYATSNRRHLIPQKMRENLDISYEDGELRPNDTTEEKTSLSDRFGLWLSFYPFNQEDYLRAAEYWVNFYGGHWNQSTLDAALLWERSRGSRSGRSAFQFSRDWVSTTTLRS